MPTTLRILKKLPATARQDPVKKEMLRGWYFLSTQRTILASRLYVGSCVRSISILSTARSNHSSRSIALWHNFQKSVPWHSHVRNFATITPEELQKRIDNINYLFTEARELIADALDSAGTKYFEEDLKVDFWQY